MNLAEKLEMAHALVELGVDRFVEVGAGTMLSALARRTVPGVPVASIACPDDLPTVLA